MFHASSLKFQPWMRGEQIRRIQLAPDECAFVINLETPLAPQLRRIAALAKSLQLARGITHIPMRTRREQYRAYLRCLDAEMDGSRVTDIATVVFSDIPNIYPDYLAKKKVRDS